jgi:hypothetical protein
VCNGFLKKSWQLWRIRSLPPVISVATSPRTAHFAGCNTIRGAIDETEQTLSSSLSPHREAGVTKSYYHLTPTSNGVSLDGTLPTGAVVCTQAQYADPSAWTIANGAIVAATPPALAQQAQTALNAMDAPGGCAIRCYKGRHRIPGSVADLLSGVALDRVNGTSTATALPTQSAWPAGT